jgi:hypothetical protein
MRHSRLFLLGAICAAVSACETPSEPEPVRPALEIVGGNAQTDTIDAILREPLTVVVRDSAGKPAQGVAVWFIGHGVLRVANNPPTDASGTTSVHVKAARGAGRAVMHIRVPSLGYADSATFTVLPGAAAGIVALPVDTAVYAARTVAPRAAVVDRGGNPRPDAVTITAGGGPVAVEGGALRATAIGRASWIARFGALADTAWISVLPQGRLAGHWLPRVSTDTARMVFVDLDGSGMTSFDIPMWWQPEAEWAPAGTQLLMNTNGYTFGQELNSIAFATPAGALTPILPADPRLRFTADPTWTRDGAWIYFSAVPHTVQGMPNDYKKSEIWRARPDGSGAERVGPPAGYYEGDSQPSVSADGARAAYDSGRGPSGVRIQTLATGGIRTVAGAVRPRWSPTDATLLAYGMPSSGVDGNGVEIRLMRADGTPVGNGRLGPAAYVYGMFSWSPDGRWIIADRTGSGITDLIEVATGQVLPVMSLPTRLYDPVWKP